MLPSPLLDALNAAISEFCGSACAIEHVAEVGGGSISRTLVARTEGAHWFVKLDSAARSAMLLAEADGLKALAACSAIRVPRVVGHGVCGNQAYLVLEHLQLSPLQHGAAAAGRSLAQLHRIGGEQFGWPSDNFIGSTPQRNARQDSWPHFFAQQRLLPQLVLARRQGLRGRLLDDGERLTEKLPALFASYRPAVSLVHGDLWHGNAALDETGTLTLYDPAVYFGDRETDLAMCRLFDGFPDDFYSAYREAWPLADGFEQRCALYQLYHVLNHLNLFGGSYRAQAERLIDGLLAQLGR